MSQVGTGLSGPLQLVKTADLDPHNNYVLGFHPHGVLVAGAFTNFCTHSTGFRRLFPGLNSYLLMLPLWFRAPFFRDYIMFAGQCGPFKRTLICHQPQALWKCIHWGSVKNPDMIDGFILQPTRQVTRG